MADVQKMACPECGHMNAMRGVINDVRQYVCEMCGECYYTPNECFGERKDAEPPRNKRPH